MKNLAPRYEGGGRRPGGVSFICKDTPSVFCSAKSTSLSEGGKKRTTIIHCTEEKAPAGAGAYYLTYSGTCGGQQRPFYLRPWPE